MDRVDDDFCYAVDGTPEEDCWYEAIETLIPKLEAAMSAATGLPLCFAVCNPDGTLTQVMAPSRSENGQTCH